MGFQLVIERSRPADSPRGCRGGRACDGSHLCGDRFKFYSSGGVFGYEIAMINACIKVVIT